MSDGWHAGLWLAVIISGLYHGLNPGMGWPLAVAAGLMERRERALFNALAPLAAGHFLAITVILLPFGLLTALQYWSREIRLAAALIVICFGIFLLVYRRHPRVFARIPPAQLGLWSFAIAIAHGAGLMLVPIYLGLCTTKASSPMEHYAALAIIANNLRLALLVSMVHVVAMIAAGGVMAWGVYRYFGLQILSKAWLNLDAFWAASLIAVGFVAFVDCL